MRESPSHTALAIALVSTFACSSANSIRSNAGGAASGGAIDVGTAPGNGGCAGTNCSSLGDGLFDPARITAWDPGISADLQLNQPLGTDGLPVRTAICASPKPGDDLNAALKNCPEGQVVQLAAGKYQIATTLLITKGVTLRGAGSKGAAAGGTTIVMTGAASVIQLGTERDQACYANSFDAPIALPENATRGSTVVALGSAAKTFSPGDLALLDEFDDATVKEGDCAYFKRVDKRSTSERVEIAAVDATKGTVTLASPLHWTFRAASPHSGQIARVATALVKWAGVEGLQLQGGKNPGYNGQMAGGIDISNAAYCWVKDVQTDGTIGGMHVAMRGVYRTVVRDSYFHHSATYGFGTDCYGIVIECGSSNNLIENNIVRYMNKPISFSVSGGGNVVGYNYVDNSWATPAAFQEINIDTHCSFPHMELVEGNYAPHIATPTTHGNSGYMTFFRNYASSQFARPAVANSTDKQTGNIAAFSFPPGNINMTVVGNVLGSTSATDLGTAPLSSIYVCEGIPGNSGCIFDFGEGGKSDVAFTTLWLHGNYDTVNQQVMWNTAITARELPKSLYLKAKPAWWPASSAWPWVGPDLTPMIGALPAKSRSDAMR